MKFTTMIAAALSMATFAIAVPVAVPAPNKGTTLRLVASFGIADVRVDIDVRQNHGKCVKSTGGGVLEDVDC